VLPILCLKSAAVPARELLMAPWRGRGRAAGGLLSALALTGSGCGSPGNPEEEARIEEGRRVFVEHAQPVCATCHTLQHADASGRIGPDLDALKPDSQRVAVAVSNGVGLMPAQAERLTPEQIAAVAHYVATVAGRAAEAE
jgi:cytochrome c6